MRQVNRQAISAKIPLPAPVGGWNARDALALMPPTDAIQLDNWFPRTDRVVVRGGSAQWATGLGGSVDTLAEWTGPSSRKLIAAANGSLFNASAAGAIGAALASGFTSNQWQTCMITTPGGAFQLLFNGADTPRTFDGTTVAASTVSGSGLTAANLIDATVYRGRVFAVEKNSLHVWYYPINSIGGVAQLLDMGQFCRAGGSMRSVATWTQDGGDGGQDDLLVMMTSEGEVIIYTGADPSSASSWQLIGRFQAAKPIGQRCLLRFGADVIAILQDGVYPVSSILKQSVEQPALAISDKIRSAFSDAAAFQASFGWQPLYYPLGQRLIVNVPLDAQGTYGQYVMNSISRAWCRFTNMSARSWALFNGLPYFGDANGVVWQADTTYKDNTTAIAANARQAYTDLGVPGAIKHLKMLRPMFSSNGSPGIGVSTDVDYASTPYPTPGAFGSAGSPWNTSPWNTSPWSQGDQVIAKWIAAGNIGTVHSVKVAAQTSTSLSWFQTEMLGEAGGIL